MYLKLLSCNTLYKVLSKSFVHKSYDIRQGLETEHILSALIGDIIAGAEVCSNMDQFTLYENIYYKISTTVGKEMRIVCRRLQNCFASTN